jgi:hypothetical protein
MPSAPPSSRVVSLTADPTPNLSAGTAPMIASVTGVMARAMPAAVTIKMPTTCGSGLSTPSVETRPMPSATIARPRLVVIRAPKRVVIHAEVGAMTMRRRNPNLRRVIPTATTSRSPRMPSSSTACGGFSTAAKATSHAARPARKGERPGAGRAAHRGSAIAAYARDPALFSRHRLLVAGDGSSISFGPSRTPRSRAGTRGPGR